MANTASNACQLELADLDRPEDLALEVPAEEAPGADQVHDAALSVAVNDEDLGSIDLPEEYGDWKDDYADAVGISSWREL